MELSGGYLNAVYRARRSGSARLEAIVGIDRITNVPEPGDTLVLGDLRLDVKAILNHRTRDCLTGEALLMNGAVELVVEADPNELRKHPEGSAVVFVKPMTPL